MKNNKMKFFMLVTSAVSIIILLIGTTFSYFTMSTGSDTDKLSVNAEQINVTLSVSSVYVGKKLIPTNDSDIMIAYKQNCVDDFGYGACLAYNLEISNFSMVQDMIGSINFTTNGIENLSYMLLDEGGNVYLPKTLVTDDTTNMPLGSSFILEDGSEVPTSKKFTLIIWLSNLPNIDQSDVDADKSFSATVFYRSIYGGELTGHITGSGNNEDVTSQVGGLE